MNCSSQDRILNIVSHLTALNIAENVALVSLLIHLIVTRTVDPFTKEWPCVGLNSTML